MDAIFDEISFGVGRKNAEPVDHPVLDAIRDADFAPAARPARDGGAAARHGRLGQPLRRPVRGRRRLRLGRRALRLARLRPQDRQRLPGARAGQGVRRPRDRGRDGQPADPVRRRQRARAVLHRRDAPGRRLRLRGPRHGRGEGARDPRRRVHLRGPQPPQLRLAGEPRRRRRVGGPQGLHAGVPRPGGVRRRDDGRARRSSCAASTPRRRATCSTAPCTAPGGSCRARRRRARAAGGGRARGAGATGSRGPASTRPRRGAARSAATTGWSSAWCS